MSIKDQVTAAVTAYLLEHGRSPNYVDASARIFQILQADPDITNKAPDCVLIGKIPVFREYMEQDLIHVVGSGLTGSSYSTTVKIGLKDDDAE